MTHPYQFTLPAALHRTVRAGARRPDPRETTMDDSDKGHLKKIETHAERIRAELRRLVETDPMAELIAHLRQPGWTTPAEFLLVLGALEAVRHQLRAVDQLSRAVLQGSREIVDAGGRAG